MHVCRLDAPRWPRVDVSGAGAPLIDGQNVTLTCSANVGRPPAIRLTWMRKSSEELTWIQVHNDSFDVTLTTDDGGISLLVSRIKLALGSDDDGAVYRCSATNGNVTQASASYTLRVQCKKHSLNNTYPRVCNELLRPRYTVKILVYSRIFCGEFHILLESV